MNSDPCSKLLAMYMQEYFCRPLISLFVFILKYKVNSLYLQKCSLFSVCTMKTLYHVSQYFLRFSQTKITGYSARCTRRERD